MRFLFVSFFVACANVLWTQEPQWTLLRENTSGVIAVDPTNSNVIYINGVLKTTDGGATWSLNNSGFGVRAFDVIIDPNNLQIIYACGDGVRMGVVKSIDGGLTWFKSDSGIVSDHHGYTVEAMALDASSNILYAADFAIGGGVYRSVDEGKYWELVAGEGLGKSFTVINLLVDEPIGTVYATLSGVWKSEDRGKTWVRTSDGLPVESINPFTGDTLYATVWSITKVKQSSTLYATVSGAGVYKYDGDGKNWRSVNNGLIENHTLRGGIVVSQLDTNVVFVGGSSSTREGIMSGLWKSSNGGQYWERNHQNLPTASPEWIVAQNLVMLGDALYLELLGLDFGGIYKLSPTVTSTVGGLTYNDQNFMYHLRPNYPNPFRDFTRISYSLSARCRVILKIFDIEGKEVTTLVDHWQYEGNYVVRWDGTNFKGGDVSNGVYFVRFQAGPLAKFHKMLVIR